MSYPGGLEPNRGAELSKEDYNSTENQWKRAKEAAAMSAQKMIAKIDADIAARKAAASKAAASKAAASKAAASKGGRKKKVRTTKKRNMKRGHMRKRKTIKKKRHAKK